jgi:hypothetical protein
MSDYYEKMNNARLDVLDIMEDWDNYTDELEAEIEKLREALKYYANEGHIREYSYGQMVMLEADECDEGVDEKPLPNLAGRTLEAFK